MNEPANSTANGIRDFWGQHAHINWASPTTIVALVSLTLVLLLMKTIGSDLDPREPPAITPMPPVIGHLLGLMRYHAMYFKLLYDEHSESPVATLPSPTGKVYVVFTPELQQSIARSKSFAHNTGKSASRVFGVEQGVVDALMGEDGVHRNISDKVISETAAGLSGEGLKRMNGRALKYLAGRLNAVDVEGGEEIPNLYLWLRHLLSSATSNALYGGTSPYQDPALIDLQWTFEGNMQWFMLPLYPSIIASKAYEARAKVHSALKAWYEAGYDQKTGADVVRTRAALMRDHGLKPADFCKLEMSIMHGATSNTIPTLYWLATFIFLRLKLVEELRTDALALLGDKSDTGKGIVEIPVSRIEETCPLLVSCWKEAIRLASQPITVRRVARDFELADPDTGRQYFFRKGADVMLPATVLHRLPSVWGADADEFNPRRFMAASKSEEDEANKKRRGAYMPFGGGKHMCPGRHFALAEILGLMTALILGYEIVGLKEENVEMANAKVGEAIAKPTAAGQGGKVQLRRRTGWEEVEWKFLV